MKRTSCVSFMLILASVGCSPANTPVSSPGSQLITPGAEEIKRVQADVSKLATAGYNADVETVLTYTHPLIVQALGGEPAARNALQKTLMEAQSAGLQLVSFTFPDEPVFLETDVRQYAIVPTLSTIEANGQRLESLNFQFGVRSGENDAWKFMEGSRVNSQMLTSMFPDFPSRYEFPDFYRKKI